MGYIRKPSYFFLSEAGTGIDELAIGSVISVASYSGTPKQFQKVSLGALTGASTLTDAVVAGNLVELGTGAGGGSVDVSNNTSVDNTYYPLFVDVITGTPTVTQVSSTKLTYNPLSGTLSSTIFNATSDVEKKENIQAISGALEVVKAMNGVTFNWKETGEKSSGVIAQELEEVLPFLVKEDINGKSVNYLGIIGYLIEAIKELEAKVG